ncbi:helix-turn-helix domain-containing protein [Bombilactobacillus apium]|nr:helix-turn-helix domain-containing protein [Bombilactobacillus apium]
MLERTNRDSLKAYENLDLEVTDINLRQAALQMHKSYGSIYNTYDGIQQDMQQLLGKDEPTIQEIFSVSPDHYHYFLVKKSDTYNFVQAILQSDDHSFTDFYQSRGNSKATSLRHLKTLRLFLKRFNVRIAYEPMRLVGKEADIRLALSIIYWSATRGYDWPFTTLTNQQANWLVESILESFRLPIPNEVTKSLYAVFMTINVLRISEGHLVRDEKILRYSQYSYSNLFDELSLNEIESKFEDTSFEEIMNRIKQLPTPELNVESICLYNLASCSLSVVPYPSDQAEFILQQLRGYNITINDFSKQIVRRLPFNIQKRLAVNEEAIKSLEININRAIIGGLTFGDSYLQLLNYYIYNDNINFNMLPEYRKQMRNLLRHLVRENEFAEFTDQLDLLTDLIYFASLRLMILTSSHFAVKVYLEIEEGFLLYTDLVNTLVALPNVKLVSQPELADLIVTSSERFDNSNINPSSYVFKWSINGGSTQFGQLMAAIQEIWL